MATDEERLMAARSRPAGSAGPVEKFDVQELLDPAFFDAMRGKPASGVHADLDWAYKNLPEFRSLKRAAEKLKEGAAGRLREFLLGAPSGGAVQQVQVAEKDPAAFREMVKTLGKSDDGEELGHRHRTGEKRFTLLEHLQGVASPRPPWLDQFGALADG